MLNGSPTRGLGIACLSVPGGKSQQSSCTNPICGKKRVCLNSLFVKSVSFNPYIRVLGGAYVQKQRDGSLLIRARSTAIVWSIPEKE